MLSSSAALFDHFFPKEADRYHQIIRDNCTAAYLAYKAQPVTWQSCQGVLSCILDHTTEIKKAQLGTTSLILGLTPTILSWLGNDVFEMSLLSSQRPMLSILLSIGAPVFSPTYLFPQWRPSDVLDARPLAFKTPQGVRQHRAFISLVQYLLAIGAIANLTHVGYLMSYMAVTLSSGCQNRYFGTLWIYISTAVHITGYLAFRSRGSWISHTPLDEDNKQARFYSFVRTEVQPCISHDARVLKWGHETALGLFLVNMTTLLVVGHVVWGTIILGSTTLVDPVDAVMLIGRFVASTVVCKGILMFELAGVREVTTLEEVSIQVI